MPWMVKPSKLDHWFVTIMVVVRVRMCTCMCMCVYIYISVYMYMYFLVYVHVFIYVFTYVRLTCPDNWFFALENRIRCKMFWKQKFCGDM